MKLVGPDVSQTLRGLQVGKNSMLLGQPTGTDTPQSLIRMSVTFRTPARIAGVTLFPVTKNDLTAFIQ